MTTVEKIMEKIHISQVWHKVQESIVIKAKRERSVFRHGDNFYKIWDRNWVSSLITDHCFDVGFYNVDNTESVSALLFDDSGPRGYVQKAGLCLSAANKNSWSHLPSEVSKDIVAGFLEKNMELSIKHDGLYADFAPSNLILFNGKINFIDLESYRSFDFVFDEKPKFFEDFDLNAWWKPIETSQRDVNAFYKACFKECLEIDLDFNIDSRENFIKAKNILVQKRLKDD